MLTTNPAFFTKWQIPAGSDSELGTGSDSSDNSGFDLYRSLLDKFLEDHHEMPSSYRQCYCSGETLIIQWNSYEDCQRVYLSCSKSGMTSLQPSFPPSAIYNTSNRAVVLTLPRCVENPSEVDCIVKRAERIISFAKIEKQKSEGNRVFLLFELGIDIPTILRRLEEEDIPEECESREIWAVALSREVSRIEGLPSFQGATDDSRDSGGSRGRIATTLYELVLPKDLRLWVYHFRVESSNGSIISLDSRMAKEVERVINEAVRPHWPPHHFHCTKSNMIVSTLPLSSAAELATHSVERGSSKYTVSVESVQREVSMEINWAAEDPSHMSLVEQLLNIVFQRTCEGVIQRFGNVFIPSSCPTIDISHREKDKDVVVYHAYRCEVNPRKRKDKIVFAVNINPCRKLFNVQSVWERICELKAQYPRENEAVFLDAVREEFVGSLVVTKYHPRMYEVTDVLLSTTANAAMEESQEFGSYAAYLKSRYQVNTVNVDSCMLEAIPQRGHRQTPIKLVASECLPSIEMESGSELPKSCVIGFKERMNESQTLASKLRAWLEIEQPHETAASHPELGGERVGTKLGTASSIGVSSLIKLKLGPQLTASYVHLSNPRIALTGSWKELEGDHNWGSETRAVRYNHLNVKPFFIICLSDDPKLDIPCDKVIHMLKDSGCQIEGSVYMTSEQFMQVTEVRAKKGVSFPLNSTTPSGNRVILLQLVKDGNPYLYQAVKQKCDQLGIPAQSMNSLKVGSNSKAITPILSNVMKQLMTKVGYMPWSIKLAGTLPVRSGIIFGVDVYHSRKALPRGKKMPSIAGLIAYRFEFVGDSQVPTWDHFCGYDILPPRQELLDGATLKNFAHRVREVWKTKPAVEAVIVYRDGVGRGMLELARKLELPQFEEVYGKMVTFVVVQKRIRFACSLAESPTSTASSALLPLDVVTLASAGALSTSAASEWNSPTLKLTMPPQGILIDDMCEATTYSCFMTYYVHPVATGVSPVHHVVLSLGVFEKAGQSQLENLKLLNYHLCFQYPTWSWPTKVPFTTQAAHKMASYISERIRFELNSQLKSTLTPATASSSCSSSSSSSSSTEFPECQQLLSVDLNIRDFSIAFYL